MSDIDSVPEPVSDPTPDVSVVATAGGSGPLLGMLGGVEVEVTIEIGRRRMKISDVLRMKAGQTLELAKAAGEPLDIYVNGQLLGRGEPVVVGDRYGVRIIDFVDKAKGGAR